MSCSAVQRLCQYSWISPVPRGDPAPINKGNSCASKVKPPTPSSSSVAGRWEGIPEAEHSHPRWVSSPANSFRSGASITATGHGLWFASPLKEEALICPVVHQVHGIWPQCVVPVEKVLLHFFFFLMLIKGDFPQKFLGIVQMIQQCSMKIQVSCPCPLCISRDKKIIVKLLEMRP